jgi:hypothetical protein
MKQEADRSFSRSENFQLTDMLSETIPGSLNLRQRLEDGLKQALSPQDRFPPSPGQYPHLPGLSVFRAAF